MDLSAVHLPNKLFEMKIPALLLALASCFFACKNDSKTKPAPTTPDTPTQAISAPPTYLEGIYATSTAPGSTLQSLFDSNPATVWHTRLGTGPDEGIMLYFPNPVALSSVEVQAEQGSFAEGKAAVIEMVGNGIVVGAGDPNTAIKLDAKPVKSLFIRFQSTGKEGQETINDVTMSTFPRNFSIGIKDIVLRNDKSETMRIVPPQMLEGSALASSTLKPETAYNTDNLFDGRKEFCWVEGNNNNSGEGESIKFSFHDTNVHITALQIWNGYQRSDEHFSANARVRDFEVRGADGVSNTYTLRDTKAGQRIELSTPLNGNEFTLTIKSVYPGKKYKDLSISEIVFFDGEKPFVIQMDISEKSKTALVAKTSGSPLAALLDRRVNNTLTPDESTLIEQSLILRSDGTFVVYTQTNGPNDDASMKAEQKTFADGNWELLRADAKTASVKIFGQWTDVSNLADYYKGASTAQVTRIFNDVLTIEKNKLSGTKMVGVFFFQ
jgi:hypothetical protein